MITKPASTQGHRQLARPILASLVAVAVMGHAIDAQRPEPQPDIRAPGITLRAGWQLLFHDGCRFAVPGSWRVARDAGVASAPDGSNLSMRVFRIASWSAHKAQIRAAFGAVKLLHEDSNHRLWFEFGDDQRTQHYIDVANGPSTCTGLLEIRAARAPDAAETAARIADSIGPAADRRPTSSK